MSFLHSATSRGHWFPSETAVLSAEIRRHRMERKPSDRSAAPLSDNRILTEPCAQFLSDALVLQLRLSAVGLPLFQCPTVAYCPNSLLVVVARRQLREHLS